MTNQAKADYLALLRSEEAAIILSVNFWGQQPAIETMGEIWVQAHLQGLRLQLHNIQQGIVDMEKALA